MSRIDDNCKSKLSDTQKQENNWRITWILAREYFRAAGNTSKVAEVDKIAKASFPSPDFSLGDGPATSFIANALSGVAANTWSWNNDKCSLDWKEFACFAYWLASVSDDKRKEIIGWLKQYPSDDDMPEVPVCVPAVYDDQLYTVSSGPPPWPKDEPPAQSKTNYLPWIIGIGAVAVIGAAVVITSRKHSAALGHPAVATA